MKGRFWKKTLSVCLALLMIAALVPAQLIASVGAATGVSYLSRSWDGSQVVTETKTVDCQDYNFGITDLNGWYYVNGYYEVSQRLNVTGTANIVIQDGSTLLAKDGIHVPEGTTLNVYNAPGGENGRLVCQVDTNNAAAIGGNDGEVCGTVNIYSGTVIANTRDNGEDAAGIGGGYGGYGGHINIYGGTVDATGGSSSYDGGAGIGGGGQSWGGFITIYGGKVTAQGGANAAGIGGGDEGMSGDIVIFGGTVKATGGSVNSDGGAGIGGGNDKGVNNIVIYGGNVTAQGGCDGAGIGGGDAGDGGNITIVGNTTVNATGGKYGAGIGGGQGKGGGTIKINGAAVTVTAQGGDYGAGIGGGQNGSDFTIELTNANVTATGGDNAAGIGGGDGGYADSITITGGIINATGGSANLDGGAGIGGGNEKQGGIITITNSDVTAKGGADGAGVGGGDGGDGGTITITDGKVEATGGANASGIGGGDHGSGGFITINSGTVIANGGEDAAGIGGGENADGGVITINDGVVTATGGQDGAGIGGGGDGAASGGNGGVITINGGKVTANGGKFHKEVEGTHYNDGAAGIGGGYLGNGGIIKITGGEVTATSGYQAAAIGGGDGGSSGNITITGGTVRAKTLAYFVSWTNKSDAAAGIGDGMSVHGDSERIITISGGDIVTETVDETNPYLHGGAGIGSGYGGSGSENMKIIITGGKVVANGAPSSAGIGGGEGKYVGEISISGDANIIARGGGFGAGIGGGAKAKSGKITISGGAIEAYGGNGGAGVGSGAACTQKDNSVDITISGGNIKANGGAGIKYYQESYYFPGASIGAGGCKQEILHGTDYGDIVDKSYFAGNIYLNGGTITANRTIGATREEALDGAEGEVYFNGATVQIETDENYPSVRATNIKLRDDDEYPQNVAYKNSDADALTKVPKADRIATLKEEAKKIVFVSPCVHSDMTYTDNGDNHIADCPHCHRNYTAPHRFGEPVWNWAGDHLSATATFTCEDCGHKTTLDAIVSKTEGYAENIYKAVVEFQGKMYDTEFVEYFKPANVSYKKAKYTPGENDPANGAVSYDDATVTDYTEVTATENTWSDGAYVVLHDTVVSEKITVTGNVDLILCDDTALTAANGITVSSGGHLNIYIQEKGTGKLIANGTPGTDKSSDKTDGSTAIEGSVTVHGGEITAIGGKGGEGSGSSRWSRGGDGGKGSFGFSGDVVIYGGTVKAVGGNGGRGGYGYYSGHGGVGGFGLNGNIEIYGGSFDLSGGIGGRGDNGTINYVLAGENGGAITATRAKIWGNPTFVTQPFTEVAYKAPTVDATGNILYYKTDVGDRYFCENRIYTPADKDVTLPKIDLKHVAAAASTCIKNGNIEYWYSEHYNKYYSDDKAKNEITAESVVLPMIAHTYGAPTWSWADDCQTATAISVCSVCHQPFEFEATVTSVQEELKTTYTATVVIDGTTYTDKVEANKPKKYVAQIEPYIDDNGAYILGTKEHYVIEGKNYAVNEDKTVGEKLDSVELNYFDFKLDNYENYNILGYTGSYDGLDELVIPKTYKGKPITALGSDNGEGFMGKATGEKKQFVLRLNENIKEIKNSAFYDSFVTKVVGDTSGLNTLGVYAFSQANSPDGYTLDITFDYPGEITTEASTFNNMNVTIHLTHSAWITNESSGSVQKIIYDITDDQHTYGEPVWSWADDCSSATATFTCTDSRCKHAQTVDAAIERTAVHDDGTATFTATAELDGRSYTDTKTGYADTLGAKLVGRSISLDGDIGVNFYMELSDAVAKSSTAYMHFTIPKNGEPATQDIKVSDARPVESGDKTYYVFKCQVAAKEMTSDIKARIIDGEKLGTEFTYSVKDYADYLLAHTEEREDLAKAAPLVKALLNYGAYAQIHFDKTSKGLANAGLTEAEKALPDFTIDVAEPVIGKLPAGTTFAGASLSLKSETTLSLYFKSDSALTFSCGKYTVENVKNGDYQVARIRGIKAKKLGSTLTLNVSGATVKYSPLNYCKYMLANDKADANLKNVLKALYWYYMAADTYFVEAPHDHTPGEAVRENVVPSTCASAGSYDETVYCTECGEEISRETKTIDKLAHTLTAVAEVPATVKTAGTAAHYECSVCHKLFSDAEGKNETTAEALVIPMLDPILDLSAVTEDTVVLDGQIIIGKLNGNYKISIADDATVTLRNADITCLSEGAAYAGITLLGNATVVLEGENTVKGGLKRNFGRYSGNYPGIYVPKDRDLIIDGEGSLYASPGSAAGEAFGCGIGGEYEGDAGNIIINNGNITAAGGTGAAGIGSANQGECGDIVILGGTVTATGGDDAAGIGAGFYGKCGEIVIFNTITKVTATKGENYTSGQYSMIGAGIGGTCGTVNIGEGLISAENGDTVVITPNPDEHIVDLRKLTGDYEAQDGDVLSGKLSGNKKITIAPDATVTLRNADITSLDEDADYAGITPLGNATIILGGENTVKGSYVIYGYNDDGEKEAYGDHPGILAPEGFTLTIDGTGVLNVSSNGWGSGIGGGYNMSAGNIVIKGGVIYADGGESVAAIGSGSDASCGDITITGGSVFAAGGEYAAGIGTGADGKCGSIMITGGTVSATGGEFAAGIGSGNSIDSSCGDITITGGTVSATGGENAAGIGTGAYGTCGKITISGGNVSATGSYSAAGIGTGRNGRGEEITITNTVTKVTATKGEGAPDSIGAGKEGACGTVTIGGVVGAISESPYTYQPE